MGEQTPDESAGKLSLWGFVVIAFFWVCGGVYGNEALVQAAPTGWTLLVMSAGGLFYALPLSMLTAEIAVAFQENGGQLVPVRETFGVTIATFDAYLVWIVCLADSAIYPIMAAKYFATFVVGHTVSDSDPVWFDWVMYVAMPTVILITILNLTGVDWIVRMNTVFFVLSMIPCVIFIGYGFGQWKFEALFKFDDDYGETDWPLLLSWGFMWLYSGFQQLGALGGQVNNPARSFPLAIVILLPIVFACYVLPMGAAISTDPDRTKYNAGFFQSLAAELACGNTESTCWLYMLMWAASIISLVALYNCMAIAAQEYISFMAETHLKDQLDAKRDSGSWLWKWLLESPDSSEECCRRIWILANGIGASFMIFIPYRVLVEFTMVIYSFCTLIYLSSYIMLKLYRKDLDRPYMVPCGTPGGIICALWCMFINVAYAIIALGVSEPVDNQCPQYSTEEECSLGQGCFAKVDGEDGFCYGFETTGKCEDADWNGEQACYWVTVECTWDEDDGVCLLGTSATVMNLTISAIIMAVAFAGYTFYRMGLNCCETMNKYTSEQYSQVTNEEEAGLGELASKGRHSDSGLAGEELKEGLDDTEFRGSPEPEPRVMLRPEMVVSS